VNFSLDAAGESLVLCASNLAVIDAVAFGIQAADVSQGRLPDGDSAIAAFPASPSPEASNYLPLTNVVINEVLTHTDSPLEDAIELHNPTAAPVEIGGWYLSDSESDFRKFRIPSGTTLPPGGFAVFYENQLNGGAGSLVPFNFDSAHGDSAILSEADANNDLTGFRAAVTFGAALNGVSFGRHLTSAGEDFVATSQRTFGQDSPANVTEFRAGGGLPNAYPLVGPVVISEIMYHPPDVAGDDNVGAEFIELHNAGPTNVSLFDPANPANAWRLRDAVDFDFPANTVILAGGRLLVVSFDPTTNAAALTAFRSQYGLTNTVLVVGPYRGKLANNGESLRLLRPDTPRQPPTPDAGFVPYVLVEQVDYADAAPWPASADGFGDSLQRVSGSLYGNEPANWLAAAADPGGPAVSNDDRDGDGMSNDWETEHGLNPDDPTDALVDLDGDGLTNREEYLAGTDPRNALSTLRLEAVYDASISLRFIAAPGRSYSIQSRDTVDQGQWTRLTDMTNPDPVPREITWPVPGAAASRFFRIVTPKVPD
jgi:hypothetical protein